METSLIISPQIVSFYEKHKERYKKECERNNSQLQEFSKKESIPNLELNDLEGLESLVRSGRKHLIEIANTK